MRILHPDQFDGAADELRDVLSGDPSASSVRLRTDARLREPGGSRGVLVSVVGGCGWVRGGERIWTPLPAGAIACWQDGEPRELWAPTELTAVSTDEPRLLALYGHSFDNRRTAHRRNRSAVRVVSVNQDRKTLLWRWQDSRSGESAWLPVGGGVKAGEEPADAARREWLEETGLSPTSVTGRHVFVHRDLWWEGRRRVADEAFFLSRVEGEPIPRPGRMLASECRWTPIGSLGRLTERIDPPQFAAIAEELLAVPVSGG